MADTFAQTFALYRPEKLFALAFGVNGDHFTKVGDESKNGVTAVHYKGEPPLNVAMIDLDEGFRMMSRVEDIDAMQVKIGMRVKFRVCPGNDKQAPYPVFVPVENAK